MTKVDWQEYLGWTEEHLEDLRYTGYSYIRQGKYDIALCFFQSLIILDPQSAYDTQTLGAIYLEMKEPQKALEYLKKGLELDAHHAPTLLNLCKALFMLERQEEGIQVAQILKNDKNLALANAAKALLLAYS